MNRTYGVAIVLRQVLRGISGSGWASFEESVHIACLEEKDHYRRVLTNYMSCVEEQA